MSLLRRGIDRITGKTARTLHYRVQELDRQIVHLHTEIASLSGEKDALLGQNASLEDDFRASRDEIEKLLLQREAFGNGTGLPTYVDFPPNKSNALKFFRGAWTSKFPGEDGPGEINLFDDGRIDLLLERIGSLEGLRVLELGPLEGAHTARLESEGAQVTAIEANTGAFLRSLITKNYYSLNAEFLLGDFTKLASSQDTWDLVFASGVLYHMTNPVQVLEQLTKQSDRLFLWTHYFDPELENWHPDLRHQIDEKWQPQNTEIVEFNNRNIRIVPQYYGEALGWTGFCGGPEVESRWIYKQDLLDILSTLGYKVIDVFMDTPGHPNGPSFCVYASKK